MDKIKKHKDKIVLVLLILSLASTAVFSFLFFSDYGRLHRVGFMPGPRGWHMPHPHGPATAEDVKRLAPWMTFSFVNKVFGLPPEYLKGELDIQNAAYPNLTIEAAAKGSATTSDALLATLKSILSERIALPSATTTP